MTYDPYCYFRGDKKSPCSTPHGVTVVWLADGRGGCGAHHIELGRLPVRSAAA